MSVMIEGEVLRCPMGSIGNRGRVVAPVRVNWLAKNNKNTKASGVREARRELPLLPLFFLCLCQPQIHYQLKDAYAHPHAH